MSDIILDESPSCKLPPANSLDRAIENSRGFLLAQQESDGHWVGELESNVTITSELVFFMRFMGIENRERERKIVNYLLNQQQNDGSWALYSGGKGYVSATIEAYMALKLAGVSSDKPEMEKALEYIISSGGVCSARIFTKIFLAMFGQISWSVLPAMPVEFFLIPKWFPFNIYEMSSWSRSVIVPLMLVYDKQPALKLSKEEGFSELFKNDNFNLSLKTSSEGSGWPNFFIKLDRFIKFLGRLPWKPLRHYAVRKAVMWVVEHQENEGDWAGIQPAMLNSLLALKYQGYKMDHPFIVKGLEAVDRFCIEDEDQLTMQSCVSPLWDTGISCNALMDSGIEPNHPALIKAGEFFLNRQVVKRGDWKIKNPEAHPGGWAFEYYNELYPDCDDTAEILMAWTFIRNPPSIDADHKQKEFNRGISWLLSMQSKNGGWGAFDKDNDQKLFNEIPFADHKAMLDPPTADVTSRVLWMLGILGYERNHPKISRAIHYVKDNQEKDGSWFGRWGVNYIYGTWLALTGLRSIGENMTEPCYRRATDWFKSRQNADGGWGETCESYIDKSLSGIGRSTASQTSWALMGLLTGGEVESKTVRRGVNYLLARQNTQGTWDEPEFTGTGFPGHFYIKYHMYRHFFPLMALARYRHALKGDLEPRKVRQKRQ